MSTPFWVLVPAAGIGTRMRADRPKQYLPLAGKTVLEVTIERIATVPGITGILVGISDNDPWWPEISSRVTALRETFPGGAERAQTVLNGLRRLSQFASPDDLVLVHDAVRPCVRATDIARLIEQAGAHEDGGLLALPVSDTVKRSDTSNHVIETVARDRLWRACTPQIFTVKRLTEALTAAMTSAASITDEASAIELAGGKPLLVECAADNIKITVPGDLALAETILASQTRETI
jgi:2-C-methyl-D-erythritol 4-phosphate cytidylyltransferase